MVKGLMFAYKVSERRACKVLRIWRSVFRYISIAKDQAYLIKKIREIASIRVRYGYRRIHILLKREGWSINHKRVYRLYKKEGLQMRHKPPRRRVSIKIRKEKLPVRRKNDYWSMDFVSDELFNGRRIRILTIVDNFTRESLCANAEFAYKGIDVVKTLEGLVVLHGLPKNIQVDNGPEFISKEMDLWAYANNVELDFSRPGRPTDNPFIESFNGRFRQECLNLHWFLSLEDAKSKIELWRKDYNENHPHSSLGDISPREFIASLEEKLIC
jgi:putative transposase